MDATISQKVEKALDRGDGALRDITRIEFEPIANLVRWRLWDHADCVLSITVPVGQTPAVLQASGDILDAMCGLRPMGGKTRKGKEHGPTA